MSSSNEKFDEENCFFVGEGGGVIVESVHRKNNICRDLHIPWALGRSSTQATVQAQGHHLLEEPYAPINDSLLIGEKVKVLPGKQPHVL